MAQKLALLERFAAGRDRAREARRIARDLPPPPARVAPPHAAAQVPRRREGRRDRAAQHADPRRRRLHEGVRRREAAPRRAGDAHLRGHQPDPVAHGDEGHARRHHQAARRRSCTRLGQARWRARVGARPARAARGEAPGALARRRSSTSSRAPRPASCRRSPTSPSPGWRDALTKHWDPKRDFALAMLHAERLTRILADEAVAELLLDQAEGAPPAARAARALARPRRAPRPRPPRGDHHHRRAPPRAHRAGDGGGAPCERRRGGVEPMASAPPRSAQGPVLARSGQGRARCRPAAPAGARRPRSPARGSRRSSRRAPRRSSRDYVAHVGGDPSAGTAARSPRTCSRSGASRSPRARSKPSPTRRARRQRGLPHRACARPCLRGSRCSCAPGSSPIDDDGRRALDHPAPGDRHPQRARGDGGRAAGPRAAPLAGRSARGAQGPPLGARGGRGPRRPRPRRARGPRLRDSHRRLQPHPLGARLRAARRGSARPSSTASRPWRAPWRRSGWGPAAAIPARLRSIDVRFTKPLVLPARVSVYTTRDGGVWVGTSPGSAAYLEGRFATT